MTRQFFKPDPIAPPAPCWIVRRPPHMGLVHEPESIEIVFVGHMLRDELELAVSRLCRWPWPFSAADRGGDVTILADIHGDAVGVRLTSDALTVTGVVAAVADIFDASIVCQATSPRPSGAMHRRG